jgi:hypothetical protein
MRHTVRRRRVHALDISYNPVFVDGTEIILEVHYEEMDACPHMEHGCDHHQCGLQQKT